ncbi:hypothetical protein AVEN_190234-1 [Araneus ventricosus]|uniref:Uncharacterized protein n=1 Tax=Araneus ventricosus TaxID=182803 RepID=A0A4Y2TTJ0_ARAVE|nr:hypothetical protein AVEN_190234-1 [Araneus ventricosus]
MKVRNVVKCQKENYNTSKIRMSYPGRVPGQFRYAVTDFPSQASQKGVLVATTLVDLEMEAISVRVLNLNNKPKIMDKGHVIATCEPMVDIVARPQEFSGAQRLPSTLEINT